MALTTSPWHHRLNTLYRFSGFVIIQYEIRAIMIHVAYLALHWNLSKFFKPRNYLIFDLAGDMRYHKFVLLHLLSVTNSIDQSPWELNSCSATKQISRLLQDPKVSYRVHKGPPQDPVLSLSLEFVKVHGYAFPRSCDSARHNHWVWHACNIPYLIEWY